jgi:putative two-component system response regulator
MGTILVADDLDANVRLLQQLLERDGHTVRAVTNGADALAVVRDERPDLVLMDVIMPRVNGFDACLEIKRDPATRLIPVVLVTALNNTLDRVRGIEVGADDFVTKPFVAVELRARVRSLLRIKGYTDDLESAESVIVSLAMTIEARDPYTEGHCQRLAEYAVTLGRALNLPEDDIVALNRGGFLHDIGKIGVPDGVLLKAGPLTPGEREVIERHTNVGDRLCGSLRSLGRVRPIVRHHHERFDGTGYPDGLKGDEIPLLAQLLGIVDVFDALTTERPYKDAVEPAAACAELLREVERGWRRRDLVEAFIALVQTGRLPVFARPGPGPVQKSEPTQFTNRNPTRLARGR